jgi:hypothetical protein
MLRLEGIPVSPGYANGIAAVYDYEIERRLKRPYRTILHAEVDLECDRLEVALEQAGADLKEVEQVVLNEVSLVQSAALLSAHMEMAKEISSLVKRYIGRELVNVE